MNYHMVDTEWLVNYHETKLEDGFGVLIRLDFGEGENYLTLGIL